MVVPYSVWCSMLHQHLAAGSTADLMRRLDRQAETSLAGMAMFISAQPGIRLAVGCVDHHADTVSILMPSGLSVSDLRLALWASPLPALILDILRTAETKGRAIAREQGMIESYKTEFRDALLNRSSIKTNTTFLRPQPIWSPET